MFSCICFPLCLLNDAGECFNHYGAAQQENSVLPVLRSSCMRTMIKMLDIMHDSGFALEISRNHYRAGFLGRLSSMHCGINIPIYQGLKSKVIKVVFCFRTSILHQNSSQPMTKIVQDITLLT